MHGTYNRSFLSKRLRWFYKPLVSRGLTFDVACLLQWQTKLVLKPLHIKNSLVKGICIEKNASKLQSSFVAYTYGCSVKVSNSVFSANTVFLIQFWVVFLLFATFSYFMQWPKGISDQHSWPNTTGKLFPSLFLLKGHFWKRKLKKKNTTSILIHLKIAAQFKGTDSIILNINTIMQRIVEKTLNFKKMQYSSPTVSVQL